MSADPGIDMNDLSLSDLEHLKFEDICDEDVILSEIAIARFALQDRIAESERNILAAIAETVELEENAVEVKLIISTPKLGIGGATAIACSIFLLAAGAVANNPLIKDRFATASVLCGVGGITTVAVRSFTQR